MNETVQVVAATELKTDKSVMTESNHMIEVNGRYLPGKTWADEGYGVLWINDSREITTFVQLIEEFSKENIHPIDDNHLDDNHYVVSNVDERPGQVIYGGADFVRVVARMTSFRAVFGLSAELDLYVRLERLAFKMVYEQDVVAFASPANLPYGDVFATCFKLAQTEDDGWIQWSSHTESYASSWLPGFHEESDRALRMLYVSRADDVWKAGWRKDSGWTKRDHGRVLVDVWLMLCVDVMTRSNLEKPRPSDRSETLGVPSYRVMYRGEEEVLRNWQAALYHAASVKSQFSADGWLLWRLLRGQIQGTGWHQEWLVERSGRAYYHIEFELVPPKADGATTDWRLRYVVVHNELDIRAPLIDWWQSAKRHWRIGREVLMEPDIWLLQSLRHAGEVCRPIRESLQTPAPSECVIEPAEVFEFITVEVPRLRAQGFTTVMPEVDTDTSKLDIRVRVQVKRTKQKNPGGQSGWKQKSGLFQADQLVEFDWNLVIDDVEISKQEFEQMVAEKTPYLQLGGSWKLIPLQAIYNQVKELNQGKLGTQSSVVQLSRTVLMNQLEDEDGGSHLIPIELSFDNEAVEAARVIKGLFEAHQPPLLQVPDGFVGTLREYQQKGYSWLVHLRHLSCGACLADDMGLGKTVQVLAYLQYLKTTGRVEGTHLLICPTSLLQNWRAEIARFTPGLRIHLHHGAARNAAYHGAARNAAFGASETVLEHAVQHADVVMTTYATLVRDIDEIQQFQWDVVIADEAQNIKNADTKQSKAICQLTANHRIALTGTPVENRLEELWAIFQFVNPGFLGSPTWFRRTFTEKISANTDSGASTQLNRLLRPVLMRRRKTDPLIQMELPEKWEVREYSALTTEQAALYQSVVNRLFHGIGETQAGMARRGQILAALVRLKQLCDHPCLVSGGSSDIKRSGKLKLLVDLLEDVVFDGESALIFTQFRDMGELICDAVEEHFGWRPKFLHGGLSVSARGEIVSHFQSGQDKSPVLVLSLKAGGVGLNLTRANHVFHFDRWWNPAVEDQATDRAFRIGQTRDVQVHKFLCPGTIEERIDTLITQKRILSSAVVGESEGWITEMDNHALQSLFELDVHAAVEEGYE